MDKVRAKILFLLISKGHVFSSHALPTDLSLEID